VTELPDWCAPTASYIPRPDLRARALEQLDRGPLMLTGPSGVGTTTFAADIARTLLEAGTIGRFAAIAVDAQTSRPDLVLALGQALRATLPGDEASLIEAMHRGPPLAVLIDDADLAAGAVGHLIGLPVATRWILTGRAAIGDDPIALRPLDDASLATLCPPGRAVASYHGRPLLAALAPGLDPESDWSASLVDAWPTLRLLADIPMGFGPIDGPLPPVAVRWIEGRPCPRRSFREALGLAEQPAPSSLGRVIELRSAELHAVACDLRSLGSAQDLRLLRTASRTVQPPEIAALATVAAARIHIWSFQASDALELVHERLRRDRPRRITRGLLRWLEGDALLLQGSLDAAHRAHVAAELDLRRESGIEARIALARRCADEWAVRGMAERARRWLGVARDALGQHPDPRGLADTLRIRANLAAQAGELVGAGSLYDEALATLSSHPDARRERAFIRIGQAAVALASHAHTEARDALDKAADEAYGDPLAEAAVSWRRAEVALHRGEPDEAYESLAEAVEGFRRAGSLRGLLLCARIEGDLAAAAGDRESALRSWRYAMTLAIRTRNLSFVRRLIERQLAVEREGEPGEHIQELEDDLRSVDSLLPPTRAHA